MVCLVGITCGWRESEAKHLLHEEYVRAVYIAGGIPVLIPTMEPSLVENYYQLFDGLIFSGGDDIDPHYFGEEPLRGLGETTPLRDSFELALAKLALEGNKPVLGICRGIQVLNIAAEGSVHQDLNDKSNQQHRQKAPRWYPTHHIKVDGDSRLYRILGTNTLRVNSFHHQAINFVGSKLRAVSWSRDGLVEAVEIRDTSRFFIGVQWHPECSHSKDEFSIRLFNSFIEEVSKLKKLNL
ncbi:MAG: peptidase C26 [Firmicutes bacterium HGW-Firmicutes-12]|jgi:putative glutamine amidotransferase|nr:MAG: peptidase C26 [Firmicutes bacterium HGW-Firmicutes-12]